MGGVGVEEDFLEQVVVFRHQSVSNGHVTLEGGAWGILVLHHACKHEGARKWYRQRIGDGLVVFLKTVFAHMQMQLVIEVAEKHLSQMVAFGDDNGVLVAQIAERCKCGAKHGMRTHKWVATCGIKLGQPGFHRGNI